MSYPSFAVTVDIAAFTVRQGSFEVALVERGIEPFAGSQALPGGFVLPEESLRSAAIRELAEETSITEFTGHLEQLGTYGEPGRDPQGRVVSIAYWAFVPAQLLQAGTDAAGAAFTEVAKARESDLAFDHDEILGDAVERARSKIEYSTIATSLCGPEFTIAELRSVYEAVWGVDLEPANFRRKVISTKGFVEATGKTRSTSSRGPSAELFRPGPAKLLHPALLR